MPGPDACPDCLDSGDCWLCHGTGIMDTGFGGGETCTECRGFGRCHRQHPNRVYPMATVPPMTVTADINPAVAVLRRAKLGMLNERLVAEIEKRMQLGPLGQDVPMERLPIVADLLRTAAEVEAVLAGIDAQQADQQPGDATTVD
jgi:succinate dehydrogenase/fumarate reductase flavoprotein subunit